jgi:hypothetical protein
MTVHILAIRLTILESFATCHVLSPYYAVTDAATSVVRIVLVRSLNVKFLSWTA